MIYELSNLYSSRQVFTI